MACLVINQILLDSDDGMFDIDHFQLNSDDRDVTDRQTKMAKAMMTI